MQVTSSNQEYHLTGNGFHIFIQFGIPIEKNVEKVMTSRKKRDKKMKYKHSKYTFRLFSNMNFQ